MSDPMKQAWNDVADGFTTLGRMMRENYEAAGADDAADDAAPRGEDDRSGALRAALEQFAAASREFGDRAGDVVRDDEVKAQAKRAASSLSDALSATLNVLGEQVGGLFKQQKDAGPPPEVPAPEPPADDARQ